MTHRYSSAFKMAIKILVFCLLSFGNTQFYAQEKENTPVNTKMKQAKIVYNAFSYSGLKTSEQHSYFELDYKISSNLFAELDGKYDSYLFADVLKVPIKLKYNITNKFYLFSGTELELTRNLLDELDHVPPQWKFTNGMGYDVNPSFSLEAKHDLNFDASNLGIYGTPSLLSIKGRVRF